MPTLMVYSPTLYGHGGVDAEAAGAEVAVVDKAGAGLRPTGIPGGKYANLNLRR